LQSWVTQLGERLSPATVRECYRLTAGIMGSAVRDRLIGFNPCEGVRLPRRRRKDTDDHLLHHRVGDVAGGHALGVRADHLVVEPGQPPRVFGDNHRFE
jgi:hypothetical protein